MPQRDQRPSTDRPTVKGYLKAIARDPGDEFFSLLLLFETIPGDAAENLEKALADAPAQVQQLMAPLSRRVGNERWEEVTVRLPLARFDEFQPMLGQYITYALDLDETPRPTPAAGRQQENQPPMREAVQ